MKNLSIKTKLLIAFFLATVVPIIFVSGLNLKFQKNAIFELYVNQSKIQSEVYQKKIKEVIKRSVKKIKLIATDEEFLKNLKSIQQASNDKTSKEYQNAKDYLQKNLQPLQRNEELNDIFIIGKDGLTYFASNYTYYWKYLGKNLLEILGVNIQNSSDLSESIIFKDPIKGSSFNKLILILVTDNDNKLLGSIALEFSMDNIYKTISTPDGPGKSTQIVLTNVTKDHIIAASPLNNNYSNILKTVFLKDLSALNLPGYSTEDTGYGLGVNYMDNKVLYVWQKIPEFNLTLFTTTDMSEIFATVQKTTYLTYISSIIVATLSLIIAFLLARSITKPIMSLVEAVQSTKKGKLLADLDPSLLNSHNETGVLANAFQARGMELEKYLDQLQQAQQQLLVTEKMAVLGNLVAGVAHEVNTPLGAINASISNIQTSLNGALMQFPLIMKEFSSETITELFDLIKYMRESKEILSSREERAVKKEIINQLTQENIESPDVVADTLVDIGIYKNIDQFLPLLRTKDATKILLLPSFFSSLFRNSNNIAESVQRASRIIFALRNYAHFEISGGLVKENIKDSIETVLTLYTGRLKQGIEIVKNYSEIPAIPCYLDELNQLWSNLVQNAVDAMPNKGTLTVDLFRQDPYVVVKITDTGGGISPEIQNRIFEPFFTTKSRGQGSGIGLSIVKKIVDKHNGKIEVESIPGKTTFAIYLPIEQPTDQAAEGGGLS